LGAISIGSIGKLARRHRDAQRAGGREAIFVVTSTTIRSYAAKRPLSSLFAIIYRLFLFVASWVMTSTKEWYVAERKKKKITRPCWLHVFRDVTSSTVYTVVGNVRAAKNPTPGRTV